MCGIFGWQFAPGKTPPRDSMLRTATALGVLNDLRGGDSWGFFLPHSRKIFKDLGCIDQHVSDISRARSVLAHTRMASTGAKTRENAHPYSFGNIVGAHNGVISNHVYLNNKLERKHEVDSMHIFDHLANGMSLKELEGWGAIEFVRAENPDVIVLAKISASGSLSITETDYGVFWSSDNDHLQAALAAGRISVKSEYTVDPFKEYFLQDGVAYIDPTITHELGSSFQVTRYMGPGNHSSHGGDARYAGSNMREWFEKRERDNEKMNEESWHDASYWQRDSQHAPFAGQVVAKNDECTHGIKLTTTCHDCKIESIIKADPKNTKDMDHCKFCHALVIDDMCLDMCDEKCTGAEIILRGL